MSLSKEAIARLERVKEQILAQPELFEMSDFVTHTECGTAFCIAGWLCVNEYGYENFRNRTYNTASEALRLLNTNKDYLFYVPDWDKDLQDEFYRIKDECPDDLDDTWKQLAELTCIAIDRFIAQHS